MKIKIQLLMFLLLGITSTLFSQRKEHIVSLDQDFDRIVTNFRCVEVIDQRLIKTNIGFAQKGLANRKVLAQLDGPFEETVKNTVNRLMVSEENSKDLVFVFHDFNISERTSATKERGICQIEIEFAVKKDSAYYSLGAYSFSEEKGGMDVTKKHPEIILTCLMNVIGKFIDSEWDGTLGEKIDFSELEETAYNFKEIPQEGLYQSFNTLGRNKPMEAFEMEFLRLDEKSKLEKYALNPVNKADKNKRVTFVSDGENLYMHGSRYSYQKTFVKAKHLGKFIYFEDRFSEPSAGIAFGLIGYAATNKLRGIILDTTNGKVSLISDLIIKNCSKDYPEIYTMYKKSKMRLADQEKAIIQINEKYQMESQNK